MTPTVPLFSLNNENIVWNKDEINDLSGRLSTITRKIDVRVKNLELAIKTIANKDKKNTMEKNLNSILERWYQNCKRLGAIPIGVYRCKIVSDTAKVSYWEYPHGIIKNTLIVDA